MSSRRSTTTMHTPSSSSARTSQPRATSSTPRSSSASFSCSSVLSSSTSLTRVALARRSADRLKNAHDDLERERAEHVKRVEEVKAPLTAELIKTQCVLVLPLSSSYWAWLTCCPCRSALAEAVDAREEVQVRPRPFLALLSSLELTFPLPLSQRKLHDQAEETSSLVAQVERLEREKESAVTGKGEAEDSVRSPPTLAFDLARLRHLTQPYARSSAPCPTLTTASTRTTPPRSSSSTTSRPRSPPCARARRAPRPASPRARGSLSRLRPRRSSRRRRRLCSRGGSSARTS